MRRPATWQDGFFMVWVVRAIKVFLQTCPNRDSVDLMD